MKRTPWVSACMLTPPPTLLPQLMNPIIKSRHTELGSGTAREMLYCPHQTTSRGLSRRSCTCMHTWGSVAAVVLSLLAFVVPGLARGQARNGRHPERRLAPLPIRTACPSGWVVHGETCYMLSGLVPGIEARKHCGRMHEEARPATPPTRKNLTDVLTVLGGSANPLWLGFQYNGSGECAPS